jgi:hypothetical protein
MRAAKSECLLRPEKIDAKSGFYGKIRASGSRDAEYSVFSSPGWGYAV